MHFLLSLLTFVSTAFAGVTEVWWNITYVDGANPDGLAERRVIGVNGTWPPPPIEFSTNDSLVVHATNSLTEPTTLHHHGMFFNSSSWFDGAMDVTQCGIPPGQSLDYHIPADTSGQWGTYWVHAHSKGQYVDGLRAPLILRRSQETHKYDEEFTVILSDWYHDEHSVLLKKFISIANPGGAEPVPDSGLVYFSQNGKYLPPIAGRTPSAKTAAVGFNENATLPFQPGKTYRLRIINTSALAGFFFWIDGHQMRIIEADGTDTEESPIDIISLTVAQRYSVLVTAKNDTSANWAVHAAMDSDMFDNIPPGLNPNATASITYNSSAPVTDLGFAKAFSDVPDLDLVPIPAEPLYPPATRTISLEVLFDTMSDGTNRAMFNNVTYNPTLVPAVFSALTLGTNATVDEAYGPLSATLGHNEIVDIVLKNGDPGKHPFHIHGHKVQLVGRAEDYTSDDPKLNPPLVEGQKNPMRRDTVQVPSMHSITLRFVTDNPGVWLFHCHIEWHLQAGLAFQFVEAPLAMQQRNNVPQVFFDQCKSLGQPFSGNAAGKASTTDLKGLTLGPYLQVLGWKTKGILAMTGCVLTAVIGMATVVWYALGGEVTDAETEREVRKKVEAKAARGRFFGLFKGKSASPGSLQNS